ncbi:Bax inhibitor-1/YccA family protein [Daejeonella oryzae]|uniref:Bax inhibitor-1/YccA family protein n=1 Tax=Daejeonella oryzae TaxID=1122943 RepID=UPI00041AECEE|nr:Bax inhibitor-1/YccA family protein [Daejeonella oryzae]
MKEQETIYQLDENGLAIKETGITSKNFLANVFLWMFVALGISASFAFYFSQDPSLLSILVNTETGRMTGLGKAAMFAPLAFVLLMSFGLNRLSFPVLALLFVAYSAITGISLSFILFIYSSSSILTCFLSASALFGVMAIAGYTTNQDLTKFGSILMMFLVGIIIASVINFFMQSSQLDYIISFVGVAIFVGLTAYDVQKLKRIGEGLEYGTAGANKMVIMGALTLYLDFLNLFLMLLRLFGSRK